MNETEVSERMMRTTAGWSKASSVWAALVVIAIVAGVSAGLSAQRPVRDPAMRIWTGVYTEAQAERGKVDFDACTDCHRGDLAGRTGPALAGPKFMDKWELLSLAALFRTIKTNMPRNTPGTLSDSTVLDLMAFILKSNGFPAGTTPAAALPADEEMLDAILVVPQGGPTKIPNFAMVQVAGCLARTGEKTWGLASATEPVSTKDVPAVDADLQSTRARLPGTQTFRLLGAGAFAPDKHAGERVFIKGIINRVRSESLLNVTAMEPLGGACSN